MGPMAPGEAGGGQAGGAPQDGPAVGAVQAGPIGTDDEGAGHATALDADGGDDGPTPTPALRLAGLRPGGELVVELAPLAEVDLEACAGVSAVKAGAVPGSVVGGGLLCPLVEGVEGEVVDADAADGGEPAFRVAKQHGDAMEDAFFRDNGADAAGERACVVQGVRGAGAAMDGGGIDLGVGFELLAEAALACVLKRGDAGGAPKVPQKRGKQEQQAAATVQSLHHGVPSQPDSGGTRLTGQDED